MVSSAHSAGGGGELCCSEPRVGTLGLWAVSQAPGWFADTPAVLGAGLGSQAIPHPPPPSLLAFRPYICAPEAEAVWVGNWRLEGSPPSPPPPPVVERASSLLCSAKIWGGGGGCVGFDFGSRLEGAVCPCPAPLPAPASAFQLAPSLPPALSSSEETEPPDRQSLAQGLLGDSGSGWRTSVDHTEVEWLR